MPKRRVKRVYIVECKDEQGTWHHIGRHYGTVMEAERFRRNLAKKDRRYKHGRVKQINP